MQVEHLDDKDLETLSGHWKLDPAVDRTAGDDESDDDEGQRRTWTRRWALRALRRALHEWLSNQWVLAEVAAAPAPPRAWATVAGNAYSTPTRVIRVVYFWRWLL